MAMVPEGAGKASLGQLYADFLNQVQKREIAPERVESVAAGILNASNSRETLSPKEAEAVIRLAMNLPERDSLMRPPAVPEVPEPLRDKQWQALEGRLKKVFEFNEKLHGKRREADFRHQISPGQLHFRVEGGIKIVMDPSLKAELSRQEFKALSVDVQELEKQKLVYWKKDLKKDMETQLQEIEKELHRVQKELEARGHPEEMHQLRTMEFVTSLRCLDSLGVPPPVNVDSILKSVEAGLKEIPPLPPEE